jgi:predicted phage tail protein
MTDEEIDLDAAIAETEARLRQLAKRKHAQDNPGLAEWLDAEQQYQKERERYEERCAAADCCLDRVRRHVRERGGVVAMATRAWVAHVGFVLARAKTPEQAQAFAEALAGKVNGLAVAFEIQPMDYQAAKAKGKE